MSNLLHTSHGKLTFPAFLPDATYGSVRSVSFEDVEKTNTPGIVTTTLHLELNIGSDYIEKYGGLHKFFGWNKPILTDSGGFQVYSLIHASNIKENKITNEGAFFKNPENGSSFLLTPEISQQIQHKLGSDIRVVLDEPVPNNMDKKSTEIAVTRNTDWAKRAKDEFLKIYNLTNEQFEDIETYPRPLIFAVIQGGKHNELRKRSFDELFKIGFDGYNWGGWPFTEDGELDSETGQLLAELIPDKKIAYAMGVGTPDDIVKSYKWGWDLFDCVLPTRNARHGFLFVNNGVGDKEFETYSVIHIKSDRYKFDEKPIEETCDCIACKSISRAYLRHLIRIKEPAGFRLATIHNLRFYSKLMEKLKNGRN
jgi:queuine tRNA-ribosyltransferase